MIRSWLGATCCLLLLGCTVEPPLLLEEDPAHAGLPLNHGERIQLPLGIAPITSSYLDSSARLDWDRFPASGSAAVRSLTAVLASVQRASLAERTYSESPPTLDVDQLQERIARVASWSLAGGAQVLRLAPSQPASPEDVLTRAEASGAKLLLALDVWGYRTAWVERDGLWWWSNLFLFYGPGIYPVVLIPDEIYALELGATASLIHVRSGVSILRKVFLASHQRSLNDAQRGWSFGGLLFLHPYTLDYDTYLHVSEALAPHSQKELERQVVSWLRDELPGRLAEEPVRELLEMGLPEQARTYALVVGANGPATEDLDRPPPLGSAENDARAVAELLLEEGVVAERDHLRLLVGQRATSGAVVSALKQLVGSLLGNDRLVVYYAGFGRTDSKGRPAFLLGEDYLPLGDMAEVLVQEGNPHSQVLFLLDTSFAGKGGRTYPGGPGLGLGNYLPELWEGQPSWQVLCASGPTGPALEFDPHGLMTGALLEGVVAEDMDQDGWISTTELAEYLHARIPGISRERAGEVQTPLLLGSEEPFLLFRALPPAETDMPEGE